MRACVEEPRLPRRPLFFYYWNKVEADRRKRSYRKGIVPRRHPTITRQNPDDCCECEILPFATRQQLTAQRTHTRGGLSPDNFGGQ